jgi:hypothetical protein
MRLEGSWNIKHNGGAVIFLSWADSLQPAKLLANGERINRVCLLKLGSGVVLIAALTLMGILTRPRIFLSLLRRGSTGAYQARGAVKTPRAAVWLSFKDGSETRFLLSDWQGQKPPLVRAKLLILIRLAITITKLCVT